ncbi:T9SS type B sorting domain-containing protein [Myroides fluvii]|uniref:T9SS type B sorting domain-containing protein n=1 Tax=Myroides fluvii TaxID=2572594 RepID=UPI00131AEE6E|nr:gliding motility-associated C-terminal domain-containing protein [Myroides fluvii]
MKYPKRIGTWLIVAALTIPSVVFSETFSNLFIPSITPIDESTEIEPPPNTTRNLPNIIVHETFENNAVGWEFANSHTNKWWVGFPSALRAENEPNHGLYLSNIEGQFSYTRETRAVSHVYKTIQLPANINDITVSFDWFCEGYVDTDWMLMIEEPMDYMRVWIVPSSYTPQADQAITVANSGGINLNNNRYVSNWNLLHENLTINLGDLAGEEIKFVFEWTNGIVGWPMRPAAIRNLKIDAIPCRPVTQFPFVETFSPTSTTRTCWTITNQNEDNRSWLFKQDHTRNEEDERITTDVVSLYTLGTEGANDDWLISPQINLNGNQRLKYTYKVTDANLPNAMSVKLATAGTNPTNFTHTLVASRLYNNTDFREDVIELRDPQGNLYSGAVHIGWHVPQQDTEGKEIMITNVIIEDIPLCSPPTSFSVTSSFIQWDTTPHAEHWEIVIQPLNTGIPTTSGINCSEPKYNIEHLTPNTAFEYYVRTSCITSAGQSIVSDWQGPNHLRTPMIPVVLPFIDNFENTQDYGIINDSINKWTIGNVVNHGGNNALYITGYSEDYNSYATTIKQASHLYKDFIVPATVQDLLVTFDWRNMGERETDFFTVWLTPTSFTPTKGRKIQPLTSEFIQLDANAFSNSSDFQSAELLRNIQSLAGQNLRLIFEWVNNHRNGIQPPAAIDNLKIKATHCARPDNVQHSTITQETVSLSWTNATDIDLYDLYISTSPTPPADNTAATHSQITNPYRVTNLESNTRYYVWVRSSCSNTNKSFWIEGGNFITQQQPATLPLNDGFEARLNWSTDIKAINQWYKGNATANNSRHAIYISSNEGITNEYHVEKAAVAHIYRDIVIPTDVAELTISYDWKNKGEISRNNPKDYFRLLQIPIDSIPQSNSKIENNSIIATVGRTLHVNSTGWETTHTTLDVQEFQGQTIRLVFEWINDDKQGVQTPAAIDNFNVQASTCLSVKNLQANRVRHTENVRLTWTPQGGETKWEVYTIEQGAPAPTGTTRGIIVEHTPTLLLENVEAGQYFEYYIRAICEGETNASLWTGPAKFSYFIPPMCVDLEGGISDMPVSENNTYIICEQGPVTKQLEARYTPIKTTDDYVVESIDYAPPFPFFGGDLIDLTQDDYWSPTIDLGFNFCFYGNTYDKVLIGANGMITFSIAGEVENGRYAPESHTPWSFNQNIPFNPEGNRGPFVNTIFGVMQDLAPNYSPEDYSVNYQVLGTFPCRALVFNIYHMGLFFNSYNPSDIEGSTQTSQIVLYEGTNIIEVYVKNRPIAEDLGWGAHNGSRGLLGIQNEDGTRAHYPGMYPNDTIYRNTGAWTATNEAWRFTPNGEVAVDFKWYKNGEIYAEEEVINVEITESTNYTAKAIYKACEGNELVIERVFNFLKQDFNLEDISDLHLCNSKGKSTHIEVETLRNHVLSHLTNFNPEAFTIEFYKDEDLTQIVKGSIPLQANQRFYVKLNHIITSCFQVKSFEAIRIPALSITALSDITACEQIVLPNLKEGEGYFTQTSGQGKSYQAGTTYDITGKSTLYIYKKNQQGCEAETSFNITLYPTITANTIENQFINCDDFFILPELSEGNKYFTLPNGQGEELFPGKEIIEPTTLYIYAQNGTKQAFCYDETSFTINFENCNIPKGISPNGDGLNDSFDLSNHGIAKIQIFNRNGIEVYSHGLGYKKQWMGQDKSGNKLPAGTYYYILISHGKQRTGWVQINY